MFALDCPGCRHHWHAPEVREGRTVTCPRCGGDVPAPNAAAVVTTDLSTPPAGDPPIGGTVDWSGGGEPTGTTTWNVFLHVLMLAGVFVLLLVPQLERWVDHHVMSG